MLLSENLNFLLFKEERHKIENLLLKEEEKRQLEERKLEIENLKKEEKALLEKKERKLKEMEMVGFKSMENPLINICMCYNFSELCSILSITYHQFCMTL